MPDRDLVLTIVQGSVSLAGLVLVFSGFLFAKAAEHRTRLGDKYTYIAIAGAVPVVMALASAWLGIEALGGSQWAGHYVLMNFKAILLLTGLYVVASVLAFRP